MSAGISDQVRRFREEYRASEIPVGYSGTLHAWFTFGFGSLVLLVCLLQLRDVQALEWLAVPLAFAYANLAEYFGHRFPMHRPFPGLGPVYKRHAGQHHRFFTDEAMLVESRRDFRALLFPPMLVIFFFGLFGVPVWFALRWAISANVAWLFISVGLAYYLNYEILHTAYHLPETHWLARNGLVKRLRWLHRMHHDQSLMAKANFNITWPIGDWLFGTLRRR